MSTALLVLCLVSAVASLWIVVAAAVAAAADRRYPGLTRDLLHISERGLQPSPGAPTPRPRWTPDAPCRRIASRRQAVQTNSQRAA